VGVPIVSVNHLEGHLASVFLANRHVPFPQTALLVSGGHCMLTRATALGEYQLLGETVDDSIGEAYDKIARYLVWDTRRARPRPAGYDRERRAQLSPPDDPGRYVFSFSGLKTAVVNYVRKEPAFVVADVAASFVAACMDVLCAKIRRAMEQFGDPALAIVGGSPPVPSCGHGRRPSPASSGASS